MSEHQNQTADDTNSAAGGLPEGGGLPVQDVAPDIDVTEISEPEPAESAPADASADDFAPGAGAPEPTD